MTTGKVKRPTIEKTVKDQVETGTRSRLMPGALAPNTVVATQMSAHTIEPIMPASASVQRTVPSRRPPAGPPLSM